ncbi:tyrosine-type recombinase/integrase [Taklimakanibacter deserti]|uniref:tyrosine-type recombinase/integrase n=1 Tax=Taklimakanibacter deserti TaxID=2267839 RepID=UPI000E64C0D3
MKIDFKYLVADDDRHGNRRYYVRKPGAPKIRLREEFGTEEFRRAYDEAMAGRAVVKPKTKIAEGSALWVCRAYYQSTWFLNKLGESSQEVRRRILDRWAEALDDRPFRLITKQHVLGWIDDRADRPEAANNFLKALRGLFAFAVERRFIAADPTAGIKKIITETDGFHVWTEDEVDKFEARHPVGSKARLALALLLYTGVRRSDLVTLGPQMNDGFHRVKQRKTKRVIMLPIIDELASVIAASPCGSTTYLVTQHGRPFSAKGFGARMRKWCDDAGLPQCTAHGLRKVGATRAADRGASERQLMAIFGWSTVEQASVYTRAADQKRMASAAIGTLAKREIVPPQKSGTERG